MTIKEFVPLSKEEEERFATFLDALESSSRAKLKQLFEMKAPDPLMEREKCLISASRYLAAYLRSEEKQIVS